MTHEQLLALADGYLRFDLAIPVDLAARLMLHGVDVEALKQGARHEQETQS